MSYEIAEEPACGVADGTVALVIRPKEKNLGEFTYLALLTSCFLPIAIRIRTSHFVLPTSNF